MENNPFQMTITNKSPEILSGVVVSLKEIKNYYADAPMTGFDNGYPAILTLNRRRNFEELKNTHLIGYKAEVLNNFYHYVFYDSKKNKNYFKSF